MAKVRDTKGRVDGNSGYGRLLDNQGLGLLFSRVHATVIRAGNELERMIEERTAVDHDLDDVLRDGFHRAGVYVATSKQMRQSTRLETPPLPDFLVLSDEVSGPAWYVIELKDGDTFDTKKAAGEYAAMLRFVERNKSELRPRVEVRFVSFNATTIDQIFEGFKSKIPRESCMTGIEFCELVGISRDEIVSERTADARENFDYFLNEILRIPEVREFLARRRPPIH